MRQTPSSTAHESVHQTSLAPIMYRILSVSENTRLLLLRNDALAIAGFSVISPRYPEQAPLLASHERVDAVVIGHSVAPEERAKLIRDLRKVRPNCVICFVYTYPQQVGEPLADLSINVTRGPEDLVIGLERVLSARDSRRTVA